MSERARRVLGWAALVVLALVLAFVYQRWIGGAGGTLKGSFQGITYELLQPRALAVLLVVPLLLWAVGWSLADLPWQQRVLSVLLRILFLALLALGLGRVARTTETQQVATVLCVDVSHSVQDAAIEQARRYVAEALRDKPADGVVKLITFAERPRLIELEAKPGAVVPSVAELRHGPGPGVTSAARGQGPPAARAGQPGNPPGAGAGTNVQAALQLAYGVFPPGYLKRVVLFTDGVETEGDALAEASRARRFDVKIFTVPYRQPPPGEVAVQALVLPDKVDVGQAFEVTATIYSSQATQARARLYQGETLNGLDGIKPLTLAPGPNEVRFASVVRVAGEVTYALELDEIQSDTFAENNRYSATVDVPGRPAILYVEGQPARASYLTSALSAQQYDVDVRAPHAFPGSLKELERYAFVILSDTPAESVSLAAQDLIEKYVRDLGGGFLFAGGEAGYGLGGWANTTVERLLPVRMDAERRKDMPSVAMALVIDRSGSMTGLPMDMAKAACKATVTTLSPDDLIEVIAFDSAPTRYVKMQPARYRSRIQNDILRIQPGGGTEIFPALDMAYQDISVVSARKKHVILLTDGRAPVQGVRDLVQAMLAEAITVTTVGLGDGADSDFLRSLADAGGGRYHHVPDATSLPKIFTRETEMISRQSAVDEWFPVQQVGQADFLKGIALNTAPLLHGYVATQMKPAPAQLILASDRGEPILARWRAGLGWAIAWTSDVKNQWSVDWLRWNGFSKFWGQLVREHMRHKHRRELDMTTEVVGNRVHAVVDAFTVDERFDNDIDSRLVVTGPEPSGKRRELKMRQSAPGRYEARFELDQYGSFLLHAEHVKVGAQGELQRVGESYGHVSYPYPREYASFEPDIERLERLASTAAGSVDPTTRVVFDPAGEKLTFHRQLWDRFVLAAIVVFLLDLLVRRVRLFDRKFVPQRRASRRAA